MPSLESIHAHAASPSPDGFAALGLSRSLLQAVRAAGYAVPTPIQTEAIPYLLEGRDLLGCAQTGTGKTAAFALPILHRLQAERPRAGKREIRALVLAPTRELASQIAASFAAYGSGSGLYAHVVYGGVGKEPQRKALRKGVDVLVATPGRLLDLMEEGEVWLGGVRHLVLDEADRMLDMGFIRDVRRILKAVPNERQTMLFSATMPVAILDLARNILVNPVRVAVDPPASAPEPIDHSVYFVEPRHKVDLLLALLDGSDIDRALVFTRTKRGANRLAEDLSRARVAAEAIHGNKSQSARERALEGFKRGRTRVVVATDVAARGIDVKGLSHVINFDLPNEPESYVHRVGRTGRAGERGVALSFCTSEERPYLTAIERLTRRRLDQPKAPVGFSASSTSGRAHSSPDPSSGASGRRPTRDHAPYPRSERPRVESSQRGGSDGSVDRRRGGDGTPSRPRGGSSGGGRRPAQGVGGARRRGRGPARRAR